MSVFVSSVLGLAAKMRSTTGSGQYKSEAGVILNSVRVVQLHLLVLSLLRLISHQLLHQFPSLDPEQPLCCPAQYDE
jgi:hypothetical protein